MNPSRKPLIAGNWKMNQGGISALGLAGKVAELTKECGKVEVLACPPFTAVALVAQQAKGSALQVGAQNLYHKDSGAYTGEVSAPMLLDIGASWVIIGHSERRQYFGETDASVADKTKAAMTAGIRPVVCVGETLQEREKGETLGVVKRQLNAFLSILADKPGFGVIAYEPVWAIGTGKTAGPAEAQEVHAMIRARLAEISPELAEKTRILYGGSMNAKNADALLREKDIDGGLIGGAALDPEAFAQIVKFAQQLA
jgi:triosephosphate isomerase